LKTRSKHQTNCGGILLAELLFSGNDDDDKQQLLLALPVCFALWQDIRSNTSTSPFLTLLKKKLIQAAKMAR